MSSHRIRPAPFPDAFPRAFSGSLPGPRDSLDSGSVSELVEDSRDLQLSTARARPWPVQHHDIVVPNGAPSLLDGLGTYGC